jgi:cyclophilin family peptidyl-prolyl cis-trans isomerase
LKKNVDAKNVIRATSPDILSPGAIISTTVGDIEIEFMGTVAPKTVYNFMTLARRHFYDGTKFHYLVKDILVQGGDPLSRGDSVALYGTGGPGYTIDDEITSVPMTRGIVAMAKSGKMTSGSQFFIVTSHDEVSALDGKFTVFARVKNGLDILEQINSTPTEKGVPTFPIVINSIELR